MLRYILVSAEDKELLGHVFDILNGCGEQMFKVRGLEHWLPPYPVEAIGKDCVDKLVFLVFDTEKDKYVSTFQMYKNENGSLYIRKVATHPDYHGHGIGKKNLAFMESFARRMGMSAMELDVYDKSEQAVRFYLSNGFVVTGKKETRRFEVLLMRKEI